MPGPIICSNELTVAPAITYVQGKPNYRKQMAVEVVTGQAATIQFTMRDPATGNPVNIKPCTDAGGVVKCAVREATLGMSPTNPGVIITCTLFTDGTDGIVLALLTDDVVSYPGISRAEFGLMDSSGNLIFSNELWLIVNRGQFPPTAVNGSVITNHGPPTIAELRLHLRDSDPVDNLWLRVQEFDLSELAACIVKPLYFFNEAPPPIRQKFSSATFPWRYFYLEAIVGELYKLAALSYARTHLPYQQQQGLVIDDKNKAEQYSALSKERLESWKDWVRHKKVELNAKGAFQTVRSAYSGNFWSSQ